MNAKTKKTIFSFVAILVIVVIGTFLAGNKSSSKAFKELSKDRVESSENFNNEVEEEVTEEETIEDEEVEEEVEEDKPVGQDPADLPTLEVHFIDVGQADAALLMFDDNNILIDAGDWQPNQVVPYLEKEGVEKLDLMIGSHPHADHIGQMDKVLNNMPVKEVWMNGGTATSKVFERVIDGIETNGSDYYEPKAGEFFEIDDMKIEILHPNTILNDPNNDSIVMRITYGEVKFLFTGDVEKKAEETILSKYADQLSANILKVSHHGSDTSSTENFVKAVNPEVAIMSVAEGSKYNHPNGSVVDLYNAMNIDLYATKDHGTIIVSTNGIDYSVNTEVSGTVTAGDR